MSCGHTSNRVDGLLTRFHAAWMHATSLDSDTRRNSSLADKGMCVEWGMIFRDTSKICLRGNSCSLGMCHALFLQQI